MQLPNFFGLLNVVLCFQPAFSQINNNDPLQEDPSRFKYSLTSNSDCSSQPKNIFGYEGTVYGYIDSSVTRGPTECTIILTSQDQFPNIQLKIHVIAAEIYDDDTSMSIYDGPNGILLGSFNSRSSNNQNQRLLQTSGDTVKFMFSRRNPQNYEFDIQVKVSRLRGGSNPENPWSWGRDFFFDKFNQDTIVGLIGGFYGLILIICIGVVVYFHFKYHGRLKRWETHQLSTMKTDTPFDSRTQLTEPSRVWAMELNASKAPSTYYSRTKSAPYSHKSRVTSEDGSTIYDHEEPFQQNLMMKQRDQNRYRDRVTSDNRNYEETEEDDPDHFVEKVIRPRWKAKARGNRNHRPPSFEEAVSERSSQQYSDESEEEETESSDDSVIKKRLTSSDESSGYSKSVSETETETESEYESERAARARRRRERREKKNRTRRRRSSTDGETSSYRSGPRKRQPQPAPVPTGAAAVPYPYPPNQFVPVMAGAPGFQPVHMVPNYPPPQYPNETQAAPRQQQVQPTDPPVYSYLVRRGYTPMDPNAGRNSPSSNSSLRGPPEEPDMPLKSGIDYMRR